MRYVGDVNTSDISSPSMRKNWRLAKNTITKKNKQIHALQKQNRLLKGKVNDLKSLVTHLQTKNLSTSNIEEMLVRHLFNFKLFFLCITYL